MLGPTVTVANGMPPDATSLCHQRAPGDIRISPISSGEFNTDADSESEESNQEIHVLSWQLGDEDISKLMNKTNVRARNYC